MLRLLFVKESSAIWSSHLDLMRALMRSFRRAGIELKHSQGFTPHPELSILMPLSVGVESQCEIAEFTLAEGFALPPEEIAPRLNPVLPAGIRALASWEGGQKPGKLAWLRARLTLEYEATGEGGERILRSAQNDRIEALTALFRRPSLVVEKHSKKGPVETDIAPMIRECAAGAASGRPPEADACETQSAKCKMQNKSEGCSVIEIEALVAAQNPTLNPLLLVTAIETYLPEYKPDHVICRRLEVYDADGNVFR